MYADEKHVSQKKGLVKNAQLIIKQLPCWFIQIHVMNNLTGALNEPIFHASTLNSPPPNLPGQSKDYNILFD